MIIDIDKLPSIPLSKRIKDLTNKQQGQLIFLKPSQKKNNKIYWWVKCSCGNIEEIRSDSPRKACHQCNKKKISQTMKGKNALDLRGQKFHKLTALYPLEQRKKDRIMWHCKCDCGNEIDVSTSDLRSGNTKSCGCLKKENNYFVQFKSNLVGQKFGYLTVLEETPERQYEKVVWKCKCECGNIVYLNTTRLKSGNDISCGCKKNSLGVLNIINLLTEYNIPFIKEYTQQSLNKKRFDFAITNEKAQVIRLVQYDGQQHFRITGGWNDKQQFNQNKKRDQQKNQWAKQHNIPLVRIPYTQRDNITLDLILSDKYLIEV